MKSMLPYLHEINGEKYISLEEITKLKSFTIQLKNSNYKIHVEEIRSKTKEFYWDLAAKENMREKFMNTIRPILKEQLGFKYSEIICEEKSKLLCQKYYEAQENGEKYEGPYLIE